MCWPPSIALWYRLTPPAITPSLSVKSKRLASLKALRSSISGGATAPAASVKNTSTHGPSPAHQRCGRALVAVSFEDMIREVHRVREAISHVRRDHKTATP